MGQFLRSSSIFRSSSFLWSSSFLSSSAFLRSSSFLWSSSFLRLSSFLRSSSLLRSFSFMRSSSFLRSSSLSTKLYVQYQIYQAKCPKCKEPKMLNKRYRTCKLNPPFQFYQTKFRETKFSENWSKVPACTELGPVQPQVVSQKSATLKILFIIRLLIKMNLKSKIRWSK